MRHPDLIARRPVSWRDFWYYDGLRARNRRQWRRFLGIGATELFGERIEEEIVKAFERHVHQCSGLGEHVMHEIVRRYWGTHPGERLNDYYYATAYRLGHDLRAWARGLPARR